VNEIVLNKNYPPYLPRVPFYDNGPSLTQKTQQPLKFTPLFGKTNVSLLFFVIEE